ncbi:gliding motility-associated C-terminal domain-containing protein, partial [Formosa maritima]
SSGGFPLNILFNSGTIETFSDAIRIENGNGTVIYEGTGNNGDLAGLTFQSTGDTLVLYVEADSSVSCASGNRTEWDFDVWCQTCIPQTVDFDVVNGDCTTDPNNPTFEIEVNITDMGDATSITVTDNIGNPAQVVTSPGTLTFGPYIANLNVIITAANTVDANCIVESGMLTFLCPPEPNPCSIIYAGEDATVDCNNPSVDLTANFQIYGQDTSTYEINALDACATPPASGGTPTGVEIDDTWSNPIDMGFEFCFFGVTYNQIVIGANGVLSFDNTLAGGDFNGWVLNPGDVLPNNTNPTLAEANIFGVAQDLNTETIIGGCGDINFMILGASPSRQFVVNFSNVCLYGCDMDNAPNDLQASTQIILYESSNAIDINIFDKPTCTSWNSGLAVAGIQNPAGNIAFTPPGRNTGVWSATNEFWRFTPSQGAPYYSFEWLDGSTSLGNTETITVSPTQTTTYTASITYDLCTGGTATITDEVEVEYINLSTYDASFEMAALCDGATATITGDTGGEFTFNPIPTDGATIDATTGEITNGLPGTTYTIQYTVGEISCPAINTVDVTILPLEDASFTMTASCDGATATITGDTGGTFAFSPEPGDGATIDTTTGEITYGVPGTTYTVEYTTSGPCSTSSTQTVTIIQADDSSFTLTANCTGATATITGITGGTFAFNPVPTDGATINPVTGEITNGITGTTYTVEYTTNGTCPSTSSQTVTISPLEDASFTITAGCNGATATITGDTGGTFAFNPVPADGATIDPVTGEITNGVSGTAYTVEYTTSGSCQAISSQTVTILPFEDASFSMTPSCNGATATIFGNTGGTFSFNPVPTDGAVIDPVTGEITNGVPEETYFVEYTTSGPCPETGGGFITLLASTEDATFMIDLTKCDGATVILTGDPGGTFALNPPPQGGAIIDPITGEVTGGAPNTNYTIEYTTSGPCPVTSNEIFTTANCVVPQVITPNGDGYNDSFDLSGFDVSSLEIFNRNGIKVYSKNNYSNEFEGISDSGDELPTGTYFYVMRYQDNEVRSDWVYINREQ